MKKIRTEVIGLVLLCALGGSTAVAQQMVSFEQDQLPVGAAAIVREKDLARVPPSWEYLDVGEIVRLGKEAWANGDYDQARLRFEYALQRDPLDEQLSTMIHELDVARVDALRRDAERRRRVLEKERMLQSERAWLQEDPSRNTRFPLDRKRGAETLKDKAEEFIVSLDFEEAQVRKVLNYLSEQSGINIIMDLTAINQSGNISIQMRDVNVIQALESILRSKGLAYRFEKDFIWVSTPQNMAQEGLVTRIYHLTQGLASFTTFTTFDTVTIDALRGDNRVIIQKEDEVQIPGSQGKGVRTFEGVKIGGSGGVAGKITHTIEDVLREIVDWPEGSRIFLDHRTSTLIIRNTPTNQGIIERVLDALDVNPPQVMIEARFVEVGADDLLDLGLKIQPKVTATGATIEHSFPFKKDTETDYRTPIANRTVDFFEDSQGSIWAFDTVAPFDFTLGTLDFSQTQAVLAALEEKTDSNTLSSPKVTTVSGQEAIIKVVKEYRYPTKYDIITYEIGSGDNRQTFVTSVPAEFKTRDIGIILRVTPNVGSDAKTINLTLIPEVSEFDINTDMFNYGTEAQPFRQPFFNVRNCTASIVVNNGETVVLGGLMREVVRHTESSVPFLGQLPLIGKLFSHKSDNQEKRNLLIFVTARLIASSGQTIEEDAFAAQ